MNPMNKILIAFAALFAAGLIAAISAGVPTRAFYDDVKINGTVAKGVTRALEPGDAAHGEVLAVSGLPCETAYSTDNRCLWLPRYRRPEKPQDVTVTICTRDGRRWVARWEEVK